MKALKINRTAVQRGLVILVSIAIIVVCFILVGFFHLGQEAAVGVFALAATLVGTVFIAVELKNSQEVTCCEMLIEQNNYFHDNERLMRVYSVLEKYQAGVGGPECWNDVEDTDIACYCTFFENLYLLYSHKIARIEDLDDLFGYRFFVFVNNPFVQERHILPSSSSYTEIFKLYGAWADYRRRNGKSIPCGETAFPREYFDGQWYLHDAGLPSGTVLHEFGDGTLRLVVRRLTPADIPSILEVQQRACAAMPDPSEFYPLSRIEIIESMHLDTVLGVFSRNGDLAGFCLAVGCRPSPRNLGTDAGLDPGKSFTFDVVVSDPAWRGHGIQRVFIDMVLDIAKGQGAEVVLATVAPGNHYSLNNFLAKDFTVLRSGISKYGGLERMLLCRKLM